MAWKGYCIQGLRRTTLDATKSSLTFPAITMTLLKTGDIAWMRRMQTKVA